MLPATLDPSGLLRTLDPLFLIQYHGPCCVPSTDTQDSNGLQLPDTLGDLILPLDTGACMFPDTWEAGGLLSLSLTWNSEPRRLNVTRYLTLDPVAYCYPYLILWPQRLTVTPTWYSGPQRLTVTLTWYSGPQRLTVTPNWNSEPQRLTVTPYLILWTPAAYCYPYLILWTPAAYCYPYLILWTPAAYCYPIPDTLDPAAYCYPNLILWTPAAYCFLRFSKFSSAALFSG